MYIVFLVCVSIDECKKKYLIKFKEFNSFFLAAASTNWRDIQHSVTEFNKCASEDHTNTISIMLQYEDGVYIYINRAGLGPIFRFRRPITTHTLYKYCIVL